MKNEATPVFPDHVTKWLLISGIYNKTLIMSLIVII